MTGKVDNGSLVLGVDVGGTKVEAALVATAGRRGGSRSTASAAGTG